MRFVDKDLRFYPRIISHDFLNFLETGIEYADARYAASVRDRADDR